LEAIAEIQERNDGGMIEVNGNGVGVVKFWMYFESNAKRFC